MATQSDLHIDQGVFSEFIITVDDIEEGEPYLDLTNYEIYSSKMGRHYSSKTKYNLNCEIYGNPVDGKIRLYFLPDDTLTSGEGHFMYTIHIRSTTDQNIIKRILEGIVFINPII